MFKVNDWFNRLRESNSGTPIKDSMKRIWILVGAVFLGISLILLGNSGDQPPPQQEKSIIDTRETDSQKVNVRKSLMATEEDTLAAKLEVMLEKIEGSGDVRVTVRLATSAKEAYAVNTTTGSKTTVEKDQGGGTRTINENSGTNQLVLTKDDKGEIPVVEMESASKVAGVLVVAAGARNPMVKERIFEAVRVALNVEPHRILVMPAEGGNGK